MKIKKIEIQGFKSFGEKQVLELSPRTNVIVGPNGSGKSNLIDAVNWVLGEQSPRCLRGERMEDIIFSGSTAKKPVGMAQVVLHIDNSDGELPLEYQEMTITRRFFRSGESQYLINKTPCRLKDIRELFMGTGSGRGSLSIIGQGQVDQILNAKPSHRREVFEEAAGISKSRLRCQEAKTQLEKLDKDAENFSFFAAEIEKNMGVLKLEADKACRYLEIKHEVKFAESLIITKRAKRLFMDAAVCSWRQSEISLAVDKAICHRHLFEKLLSIPMQENKAKNLKKEEVIREVIRIQLEKEHLADRMHIAEERKLWLEGRLKECSSFLEKSSRDIKDLLFKKEAETQNCSRVLREMDECKALYTRLKDNAKEIEKTLEQSKRKSQKSSTFLFEVLNEQARTANQLSALDNEASMIESEINKIKVRIVELQGNRMKLKNKIETDSKRHESSLKTLDDLTEQNTLSEQKIKILEQRLTEVFQEYQRCRDKHSEICSRKKLIAEMQKNYEGYTYGVQELLTEGKGLTGICGVVGDLIEVPQPYRIAVEIALGSRINNIVTNSAEDAKNAIKFLKDRNGGRLTFLPLNLIRSREDRRQYSECILAVNLVKINSRFSAIADYLLGKIYIVENIDTALRLAKIMNYKYTLVTIGGEMLHPGGAISGGSLKRLAGGVIGRRKIAEQMDEEIIRLEERITSINKEKDTIELAIAAEREKVRLVVRDITEVSIRIQELETGMQYGEKQIEALSREEKILLEEQNRLRLTADENLETQGRLSQKKEFLKRKKEKIEKVTKLREDILKDLKQKILEHDAAIVKAEIKLSALEQKYDYLKKNVEQLSLLHTDMSFRYKERTLDYEQCLADAAKLSAEIEDLDRNIKRNQQQLNNLTQSREELDQSISYLEKTADRYSTVINKIAARIQELEQEQAACRQRFNALQIEIKGLEQNFRDNNDIGFVQLLPGAGDLKGLEAKVSSLRKKMGELEPVNVSAIEEYSRIVRDKAGFSERAADIKKTQKHLRQLINLVEKRISLQFKDFFLRMQTAFNDTYVRVFGGGNANLMVNDYNYLGGDIQIMVQPPGKRSQSLLLLSGGERALTALTLLFAILQENCTPFCILDEVDTSLDESNIELFTRMLEYYSSSTQFIVVSHRQGTMEAAENLFGVTMPEDGVSAIVSVNLERQAG